MYCIMRAIHHYTSSSMHVMYTICTLQCACIQCVFCCCRCLPMDAAFSLYGFTFILRSISFFLCVRVCLKETEKNGRRRDDVIKKKRIQNILWTLATAMTTATSSTTICKRYLASVPSHSPQSMPNRYI